MSDKYIIKNCPAFNNTPNMYGEVSEYCDNEHDIDLNKCMCENITDCAMKQIVELCRNVKLTYGKLDKPLTATQCTALFSRAAFADEILNILGIQEVE